MSMNTDTSFSNYEKKLSNHKSGTSGRLRAAPSRTKIQTLHAAEGLPTSFSCEHWMLPAIAQLMAAAASCSPVARLLGTRRRQQDKASFTFRISPDLQGAWQGSMATSICPEKAVGELSSSGGTESKQAVHLPQQDTARVNSCYRS